MRDFSKTQAKSFKSLKIYLDGWMMSLNPTDHDIMGNLKLEYKTGLLVI